MKHLALKLAILSGLLPCALLAVDGVVLIDQSKALAGNVTAGDAPGFPVTISQSGSYRLDGNLIVPDVNTDAIQIAANNVTIDLNGFSIIGSNVCTIRVTFGVSGLSCAPGGEGASARGIFDLFSGAIIRNGTIRGMGGFGIQIFGNAVVEDLHVYSNGRAGIVVNGESIVKNCIVELNQYGLLQATGLAINVVARNNPVYGIQGNQLRVIGARISNNGIGLAGPNTVSYVRSFISGNATDVGSPDNTAGPINAEENICGNAPCLESFGAIH